MPEHKGSKATTFDFGPVEIEVALGAGPRITGYSRRGGPQLFAQLAGEAIEHPAIGTFRFLGGHRLWRAPEVPAVTYQPDGNPVRVEQDQDVVTITGAPDSDGIVKAISIHQRDSLTVVDHTLRHDGALAVSSAAWAITQLTPGGVAFLPAPNRPVDADGVLPNRSIAVWPYTDLSAPEIAFCPHEIQIAGSEQRTQAKIGQENRRGWIAYVLGDELFVKWSPIHRDDRSYADLGSSVECYRDHRFLELESLGPLTDLDPGQELRHREVWMLTRLDGASPDDVLASLPWDPLLVTE